MQGRPTLSLSRFLPLSQVELQGDDIHYTRTIAPAAAADGQNGGACSHYGILLARTAGLPQHITERAMQVCIQFLCSLTMNECVNSAASHTACCGPVTNLSH
jgi:DNA mismatch repair ATPase MutS